MLAFLKARLHQGETNGWTISQRGGGAYRNITIHSLDDVGLVTYANNQMRFIPWNSINELYRDTSA